MCDKLTFEVAGREYEKMWVGTHTDEALKILSYRVSLTPGEEIELTDGTKAVVIDNDRKEKMLICATPIVGDKYEYGCRQFAAPYNVVKCRLYGEAVDFEDVIRVEGPGITRSLIEQEAWQEAADMLDDLRSISVDISEFAGDLATIYAGIQEDEKNEKDASKRIGELLEMLKRAD